MTLRDRLLFATSALLYSGPLYAGLAGYGSRTLVLFSALLMVWLFIVRPGDWPESRADWRHPRAIAWPMLIFAVQILVVSFCLSLGHVFGVLFDLDLPLPLAAPVGLSLSGILIAWAMQRRRGHAPILRRRGRGLDVGTGILDVRRPPMPGRIDKQAFVEDIAAALGDLGDIPAPDAPLDRLAALIAEKDMTRPCFEALEKAGRLTTPQLQLLARLALSPEIMADLMGQGRIGPALERALLSDEVAVIAATARLARERLIETPALADELPHATVLRREAEARAPASREQAMALSLLARAIDPLARPRTRALVPARVSR